MKLKDKHILVIGGTSGVGRAIIELLLREKSLLTITTRNKKNIPNDWNLSNVKIIETDVSDDDSIKNLADNVTNIDGIVYTPGIVKLFPVGFINRNQLEIARKSVFDGAVLTMTALLRGKKVNGGSSIVFISSISSSFPFKGGMGYATSKAALETYSKVLAIELAEKGIRSNCIKAGLVSTQMNDDTKENIPDEKYKAYIEKYPLGLGSPEDIANAVVFLLSNKSKWITGTEIILDGGLTAGA